MKPWLLIVCLFVCHTSLADTSKAMHELDIALAKGQSLPLAETIRMTLHSAMSKDLSDALRQWSGISIEWVEAEEVTLTLIQEPRFIGPMNPMYSKPSFVVDYDEAVMQDFINGYAEFNNTVDTLESMVAYVANYIDQPTYIHGFNIASVVSKNRSGDCTEYAVLLAALARSQHIPSRVMFGTVITEENQQLGAFGHAWTEVWYQNQWHSIDAALLGSDATRTFYLPSGALDNEGPGFTLALAGTMVMIPSKIVDVENI